MRNITRSISVPPVVLAFARTVSHRSMSVSRHGVLAAERMTHRPANRAGFQQMMAMLAGSTFIGLGVSLFVHARLGVPAYDVMLTAIRDHVGVTLGQASWMFTGFLVLIAAALGQYPRLTTLVFILANGLAVDLFMTVLRDPSSLFVRMAFVLLGTLAIAFAVALVLHAGLTGGSMELILKAAEERNVDPFKVRRLMEATIVAVGVILGGDLGFATVFYVLTMSPALKAGQQALNDHRQGRTTRLNAPSRGRPLQPHAD